MEHDFERRLLSQNAFLICNTFNTIVNVTVELSKDWRLRREQFTITYYSDSRFTSVSSWDLFNCPKLHNISQLEGSIFVSLTTLTTLRWDTLFDLFFNTCIEICIRLLYNIFTEINIRQIVFKDVFGSFFAHYIAQVFHSIKPRERGFESRRRRNFLLFLFPYFF